MFAFTCLATDGERDPDIIYAEVLGRSIFHGDFFLVIFIPGGRVGGGYGRETAAALAYLHRKVIIHSDFKCVCSSPVYNISLPYNFLLG